MTNIIRWNPRREMSAMQRMMDRFFEDWRPFFDFDGELPEGVRALALDVHEDDHTYIITTEMPGVQPEHIQVRQDGDYLLIEGEIPEQTTEHEGKRALVRERRSGRFRRRTRLPQNINVDQAEAHYENGVLTLTLPKSEAVQPKMIPVKTSHN